MMPREHPPYERWVGIGWTALCVLAWSLVPKLAWDRRDLDSHQYLMWSSIVSAITLLACTRAVGMWSTLTSYSMVDLSRLVGLGALGAFGYHALLYWTYTPCGANCLQESPGLIIAQYAWPALSVVWSALLLREHLTVRILVSLLLSLLAVAIGATPGAIAGGSSSRLIVVLVAATMFGLYSALIKRANYEPFSSLAVGFATAAVLSSLEVIWLSNGIRLPAGPETWTVIVNGLVVNGLSYVCWYRALRAAPVGLIAPLVALTPVLATILASPDGVTSEQWTGVTLVLLSVLVANLDTRTTASTAPCEPSAAFRTAEESAP